MARNNQNRSHTSHDQKHLTNQFDEILSEIQESWQKKEPPTKIGKILAKIKMRNTVRNAISLWRMVGVWRLLSFPFRKNLPDFFIIGAAKSGTTTLFDMVTSHPDVCGIPAVKAKEPRYFGASSLSLRWYRCLFPIKKNGKLACDASTHLLPSLLAPMQIRCVLPNAKFIAILRDPVDRSLSHYEFDKRHGLDVPASFEDALRIERMRMREMDVDYQFLRYIVRGHYAEQLERWFSIFDRDQFLILTTTELQKDRQKTIYKVFNFLGLSKHNVANAKNSNTGKYSNMHPETRRMLAEYYRPHNERLYKLLGRKFDWN